MEPIRVETSLRGAQTADKHRVHLAGIFTVAIGTAPDVLRTAANRLLGLSPEQVRQHAEDIILAGLREQVASIKLADLQRAPAATLQSFKSILELQLQKIGLVLLSTDLTSADLTDVEQQPQSPGTLGTGAGR